jgi:adenine-specific DNA glycosylase
MKLSPFLFEQEQYIDDPWKMIIVCMMLNQTSYKQVDRVKDTFFGRFPDAEILLNANDEDIIGVIRSLGFYNRRCKLFKDFSREWIKGRWEKIEDLPGVGKYASDSWKIFQEGKLDIDVQDKELKKYVEWARNETN